MYQVKLILFNMMYVGDSVPVKQSPYRVNPLKGECLRQEINFLLEHNIIESSKSEWVSPCILVPKPDKSFRLCTGYRKLNRFTKTDPYPLPRMDDIIDQMGKATYVTKVDLLKGYYQIGLTDRAKLMSAFVTPDGFFQYLVMPFGMKNTPATFQRLIHHLTVDLKGVEAYIDDIIMHSEEWEDHLRQLSQLFGRLQEAGLTVNLTKSEFGRAQVTYLGHTVGQGRLAPVSAKVAAILEFPPPQTRKQMMRFLGMIGYYRRFCPNLSVVAAPLTDLLRKNCKFEWTTDCEEAFKRLKGLMVNAPVLRSSDYNSPFILHIDASNIGIGAVLLQENATNVLHPVCYYSAKLKKKIKLCHH